MLYSYGISTMKNMGSEGEVYSFASFFTNIL